MNQRTAVASLEHLLSGELARALADAGFCAIGQRKLKQAQLIFETLRIFRPGRDFPIVGLALTAMDSGEHKAAILLLQEGIGQVADNAALRALLGMAYLLDGKKNESAALAQAVIVAGAEPGVLRFARALQDELERRITPTAVDWNNGATRTASLPK